jgi:hypothetical protein
MNRNVCPMLWENSINSPQLANILILSVHLRLEGFVSKRMYIIKGMAVSYDSGNVSHYLFAPLTCVRLAGTEATTVRYASQHPHRLFIGLLHKRTTDCQIYLEFKAFRKTVAVPAMRLILDLKSVLAPANYFIGKQKSSTWTQCILLHPES